MAATGSGFIYTVEARRSRTLEHPSNVLNHLINDKADFPLSTMAFFVVNAEPTSNVYVRISLLSRARKRNYEYIKRAPVTIIPIPRPPPILPSFHFGIHFASLVGVFFSRPSSRPFDRRLLLFFLYFYFCESRLCSSDTGDKSHFKKSVPVSVPDPVNQYHQSLPIIGAGWGAVSSPSGSWQLIQFPVSYIYIYRVHV